MGRVNFLLVLFLAWLSAFLSRGKPNGVESNSFTVLVDGELRKVSPYYLSVALSSQIVKNGLIIDLARSKKFVTLAKALSPAILRVGGSSANFLTYEPSSKSGGGRPSNLDLKEGGDADYEGHANEWDENDFTNFTMTAEDFKYLKEFAKDSSLTILFDVNQFYRTPEDTWDSINALDIFNDADESFKWQLGNEPNSYYYNYKYNYTGTMDAADYLSFKTELERYFEEPEIVGPDVTNPRFRNSLYEDGDGEDYMDKEKVNGLQMKFLDEFLANLKMKLTAVSWHHYYLPGANVTVEDYTSVETLNMLTWQIPQAVELRDKYCPDTPLWLTETSSSVGGGAKNFSDTYIAGFLWLDKLGLAAVQKIDLLARQTLYQKRYALINDIRKDFKPNPDYWLSVLYKRLVGVEVLKVITDGSPDTTRLYGHCQKPGSTSYKPGNVVIFGVNVDPSKSSKISFKGMTSEHKIHQYLLEPPNQFIQSTDVMLNGKLLEMTPDDQLPDLEPQLLSGQEIEFPPLSFGFWVVVDAHTQDCETPHAL
ncbi:inactive heparanase-2-like [Palaemon carinicauda]|uniref:inactive heparanase-2-like n=1 Tax=Palaemon carinicauda TaxID=392227 RepID=UPI0035B6AA66